MKPIIGMLGEVLDNRYSGLKNAYASSIEAAGGLPLLLPYVEVGDTIEEFVSLCDGFLFTGGADVDPERYGAEKIPKCGELQKYRDELEFRVLDAVLNTKKPIMAICRGSQLINVALGGNLYQDIPSEYDTSIIHSQTEGEFAPSHHVNIKNGTPLSKLLGKERIVANSFHHQAIKRLGRGLSVMAVADDGIIEAIYLEGERYLRAYQWHPERLYMSDKDNNALFVDFIATCSK